MFHVKHYIVLNSIQTKNVSRETFNQLKKISNTKCSHTLYWKFHFSEQLYQIILNSKHRRLCPVVHVNLLKDIRNMIFYCSFADI